MTATATVERPILFTAPMVRAILAPRKSQTRRTNGLDIINEDPGAWAYRGFDEEAGAHAWDHLGNAPRFTSRCPYGKPWDKLWVRETWAACVHGSYEPIKGPLTRSFYSVKVPWSFAVQYSADYPAGDLDYDGSWRPSIHMPRWASRITLDVTGIRVERLQEISEADAKREGAKRICDHCGNSDAHEAHWACEADYEPKVGHRVGFQKLWESINGKDSWAANPWVWVVEFARSGATK